MRTRTKAPASIGSGRRKPQTLIGHLIGVTLAVMGLGMFASAIVEKLLGGNEGMTLFVAGLLAAVPGVLLWRRTEPPERFSAAATFAGVLASWATLAVMGAVPYQLAAVTDRFDLALFESVSGFTTTGATILRPISEVPPGILFWRAITQWIGGIGAVVFAVSVLSYLGVAGMELLNAEAPGPAAERLAPRVRETAKRLIILYLAFTGVLAALFAIFGMSAYDAVTHSFTTVSTGGFSPHNASFAHFDSAALEWIALAGMIFAGGNFALYWRAVTGKPVVVFRSTEFRAYLVILGAFSAMAVGWTVVRLEPSGDLIRQTIFSTVSIATSTGFTILDYDLWPGALQLMLLFAMGLGGMAGSTAGGFKVFRLLAVLSYARRQTYRQLHPHAVSVIRFGKDVVPDAVVARVVGFFVLFMAIGGAATFAVAAFGTDMRTAIAAAASSIGNVGPGLGDVGPTRDFLDLHAGSRAILILVMLIGRLEIFPVLLGVVPMFRFVSDRLPPRVSQLFVRVGRG